MANSSRITRGQAPRALQLGLDRILSDLANVYKGPGDSIFKSVATKKAYLEIMKMAGMGPAARKGEGETISYDSRDQAWVYQFPIVTYEKSARVTMEAIEDNQYEDQLPEIGKELMKSIDVARDTIEANVFNNAFAASVTYGDGSVLCATSHALQAGGTSSNRLAVDSDLSEDSLESMKILADAMKNDDGILGDYDLQDLLVHPSNQFEAHRILKSMGRVNVPDNDANALRDMGVIRSIISWRRLTDSDAFFATTNCDNGLILARRKNVVTRSYQEDNTYDTVLTAHERYAVGVGKWQSVIGTPGA
jgi:hypothetical protein